MDSEESLKDELGCINATERFYHVTSTRVSSTSAILVRENGTQVQLKWYQYKYPVLEPCQKDDSHTGRGQGGRSKEVIYSMLEAV